MTQRAFCTPGVRGPRVRLASLLLPAIAAMGLAIAAAQPRFAVAESSSPAPVARPEIAIIIDDLGRRFDDGRRVIDLPGPVACAFLPYGRHTQTLAHIAHAENKEVMLHLPMQAVEDTKLDAGALTLDMTQRQVVQTIIEDLNRVPHVSGVNNHMGSLLTRHPGHMVWLMEVLQAHDSMFFVDSRTTHETVAHRIADENRVPVVSRDVFLDDQSDESSVVAQFQRLIATARKKGSALAIGHPHEATLRVLRRELNTLENRGIKLVPVRRLAKTQREGNSVWQLSLSRLHRDVKNSRQ